MVTRQYPFSSVLSLTWRHLKTNSSGLSVRWSLTNHHSVELDACIQNHVKQAGIKQTNVHLRNSDAINSNQTHLVSGIGIRHWVLQQHSNAARITVKCTFYWSRDTLNNIIQLYKVSVIDTLQWNPFCDPSLINNVRHIHVESQFTHTNLHNREKHKQNISWWKKYWRNYDSRQNALKI